MLRKTKQNKTKPLEGGGPGKQSLCNGQMTQQTSPMLISLSDELLNHTTDCWKSFLSF